MSGLPDKFAVRLALLVIVAVLVTLGPLWWWALRGMSPEVGTAWVFTALTVDGGVLAGAAVKWS